MRQIWVNETAHQVLAMKQFYLRLPVELRRRRLGRRWLVDMDRERIEEWLIVERV